MASVRHVQKHAACKRLIITTTIDLGEEGLAYLGILIGAFVVLPPFFLYLHRYLEPQFDENGNVRPEARLPAACVGAFFIPICLFWVGYYGVRSCLGC
jgi:hypothetical protein